MYLGFFYPLSGTWTDRAGHQDPASGKGNNEDEMLTANHVELRDGSFVTLPEIMDGLKPG